MRPACYYFNYNTEAVGVCVAHYFKGSCVIGRHVHSSFSFIA